ncbi:hypothetical protein ABWH96_17175 [Marivirga tractuosa]|uniref:hypothetical protein n=1 Tax=Marivirga tractuosa TaxID=1006 RepID=UPI0035CF14A3
MNDKIIHVFAGPNAVGKSTLGEEFAYYKGIPFVNPEEISRKQFSLYKEEINFIMLHHIMDIDIKTALDDSDQVIIESNLHDIKAYKFIDYYISKYRASSICYFHYTDDINILKRRAKQRPKHLGHMVPESMLEERYNKSFELIIERIHSFDEIHFLDNSKEQERPDLILEVLDGELNYINQDLSFDWTNKIINELTNSE